MTVTNFGKFHDLRERAKARAAEMMAFIKRQHAENGVKIEGVNLEEFDKKYEEELTKVFIDSDIVAERLKNEIE